MPTALNEIELACLAAALQGRDGEVVSVTSCGAIEPQIEDPARLLVAYVVAHNLFRSLTGFTTHVFQELFERTAKHAGRDDGDVLFEELRHSRTEHRESFYHWLVFDKAAELLRPFAFDSRPAA